MRIAESQSQTSQSFSDRGRPAIVLHRADQSQGKLVFRAVAEGPDTLAAQRVCQSTGMLDKFRAAKVKPSPRQTMPRDQVRCRASNRILSVIKRKSRDFRSQLSC